MSLENRTKRKLLKRKLQTQKRLYDRHTSPGKGRGKEIPKKGAGKYNWGTPFDYDDLAVYLKKGKRLEFEDSVADKILRSQKPSSPTKIQIARRASF